MMFKNECSRNCWLAAAVVGLAVWLFNATLVGGFVLGLIAFVLLGSALIWLVCNGRGGATEDAAVMAGDGTAQASVGDGVLHRAEQAVVDASNAFATGTAAAVAKGREAWQDMRDDAKTPDRDDDSRKDRHDDDDHDDDDDDDDDESILERAEERLEKAGEAVKDAMGALAARGKEAISSLKSRSEAEDQPTAEAPPAALSESVSPSGQSAVPTDPAEAEHRAEPSGSGVAKSEVSQSAPVAEPSPARDEVEALTEMPEDVPSKSEIEQVKAESPTPRTEAEKPQATQPATGMSRTDEADDLKEIKGIGPALEATLHENDVTSFAQIAAWSETDIDHYAELIGRMGGRIRSDDWVAQAKVLAKGGETEFSRRVDKGEVY